MCKLSNNALIFFIFVARKKIVSSLQSNENVAVRPNLIHYLNKEARTCLVDTDLFR